MPLNLKTQASVLASLKSFLENTQTSITDFNTGSAISTVLNTVARSSSDLYANLEDLYTASFISTATGTDLDARAADFLIFRKQATAATVPLTFFTNTFNPNPVTIPAGSQATTIPSPVATLITYSTTSTVVFNPIVSNEQHVYTVNNQFLCNNNVFQNSYALGARVVAAITSVTGIVNGQPYTFNVGVDCILDNTCDANQSLITWIGEPVSESTPLEVTPLNVPIAPDDGTVFEVSYNALSIDVPAQATNTGSVYRVTPFQISVPVNLPTGMDGVTNYVASEGGDDAESDASLRQDVRNFLSSIGGPTVPAIIAKVNTVSGVASSEVIEPNPPQGFVTVIPDDGTGHASAQTIFAVLATLNGTPAAPGIRPAGIMYSVIPPVVSVVNITAFVKLAPGTLLSTVQQNANTALTAYFDTLTAGSTVVRVKIASAISDVGGVTNLNLDNLLIQTNDIPPLGGLDGDIILSSNVTPRLGVVNIQLWV